MICGTGEAGYNGQAIPGVNAMINEPWSGASDASGNLYFSNSMKSSS